MAHFLMAFNDIDVEGAGVISMDDVRSYMKREGCHNNFVKNFFNLFDIDGDGLITLEEYCTALGIKGKDKEKILRRASRPKVYNMIAADTNYLGFKDMEVFNADMSNSDQVHVIETCRDLMEQIAENVQPNQPNQPYGDTAEDLKCRLDDQLGPLWHVAIGIGRTGANICHIAGAMMHFRIGHLCFLVWQTPEL